MARSLLDWALYYKSLGWSVVPAVGGMKTPAVAWAEFQQRKTTEAEIRLWFGSDSNFNIGVVCGGISDNLMVLDIDAYKGVDLLDRAKEYLKKGGIDLDNNIPNVKTPRGGRHYYFKTEKPVRTGIIKLVGDIGIEVRAEGAFIVCPPSVFGGNRYEWVIEPVNLPFVSVNQLISLGISYIGGVSIESVVKMLENGISNNMQSDDIKKWCQNLLGVETSKIYEGTRNVSLTRIVGMLYYKALPKEMVYHIVSSINNKMCEPPLPEEDVRRIVDSVQKTAIRHKSEKVVDEEAVKIINAIRSKEALSFDKLIKIDSKPPEYEIIFSQEGGMYSVRISDKDLFNWCAVQRQIANTCHVVVKGMKKSKWEKILSILFKSVEIREAPPFSSNYEIFVELLKEFITTRIADRDIYKEYKTLQESLRDRNHYWYDETKNEFYFVCKSFNTFLNTKTNIPKYKNSEITEYIFSLNGSMRHIVDRGLEWLVYKVPVDVVDNEYNKILKRSKADGNA